MEVNRFGLCGRPTTFERPIIRLEYDSICVVTDRFTKYAYIVLVLGTINADIIV